MNKDYEIEYTPKFLEDLETHKKAGKKSILLKIEAFIDELKVHPTTGTGSPEPLKGDRKGQWSRRITHKHRLIYEIHNNIVTVVLLTARGHYEDT
jgi:toxin YoeB